MLLVAIAAIYGPGSIGLEGNLTCLSALCARGIVHFSGAAAKAASAAASISFHFNSLTVLSIQRIDLCHKNLYSLPEASVSSMFQEKLLT
jgi:hypothetical protein